MINLITFQDAEEGFGKGVTTEEATGILVNSYKTSEIRNQVQIEVTKISEGVSFNSTLFLLILYNNDTKNNIFPKPIMKWGMKCYHYCCMWLGIGCGREEEDPRCISHSMPCSYKKIFRANVSWHKQLLVTSSGLYCNSNKLGLYLLSHRPKYWVHSGKAYLFYGNC